MTSRLSSSPRSRANPRRKSRSAATTMTEILGTVIEEPVGGSGSFESQGWIAVEHLIGSPDECVGVDEPRSDHVVRTGSSLESMASTEVRGWRKIRPKGDFAHQRWGLSLGQGSGRSRTGPGRTDPAAATGVTWAGCTGGSGSRYVCEGGVYVALSCGVFDWKAPVPPTPTSMTRTLAGECLTRADRDEERICPPPGSERDRVSAVVLPAALRRRWPTSVWGGINFAVGIVVARTQRSRRAGGLRLRPRFRGLGPVDDGQPTHMCGHRCPNVHLAVLGSPIG